MNNDFQWACLLVKMHVFVFLVFSLLPIGSWQSLKRCSPPSGEPTCVCKTHHGIINLTKIAQTDGSPRFHDPDLAFGRYHYDYNPCFGFSIGSNGDCNNGNTAICQNEKTLVSTIDTEAMYYNDDEGNYELHYSGGDETRSGIVYLHCDEAAVDPIINTTGDSETQYLYLFNLYTNEACLKAGHSDDSGYIGFILISLALTGLLTYFIVGGIILKFHKKESGTDIIPNKKFWFSLPFLVKDGVKFVATPCMRVKYKDYQPI